MKIAVLGLRGIPNIPGGIETHCQHLYPRLIKHGCDITVYARSPYVGKKPYTYQGVKIFPVWTVVSKTFETIVHTILVHIYLIKHKPDIIHFHGIGPSLLIFLSKLFGYKVVATHHGFDYDRDKWGSIAKHFLKLGENQLRRANAVICISDSINSHLQSRQIRNTFLIPNGVELPEILPADKYCKKWLIKKGAYYLFTGRFVPEKCIHDLLSAFGMISSDWKMVIAGDADHPDTYSKKIRHLAKNIPNVVLTGYITGNELNEIYSNAGCFILPSSHEGLPISLLEAMSYGLPCIVSNIPANMSIQHKNITYFPVHDVSDLASKLEKMASTSINFDRKSSRKYVFDFFNWDIIANDTLKVYSKILKMV